MLAAVMISSLALAGCGPTQEPEAAPAPGPVARMIRASAEANRVPAELMLAIAEVEGGLKLAQVREIEPDDAVPIAGVLELRRGRYNSLARGAELMAMSEVEIAADLAAGTEAGARVLDDLARELAALDRGDLAAWAPVVEVLSGHLFERDQVDYRARVFSLLRYGRALEARGGERIMLAAREDVPLGLTIAPPAPEPLDEPEYPGAIWFETSCNDKCTPSRNAPVSMIAIHDTEGGWDASVATLQNDPGKSVHYIVDKDGSRVGQFIPESYTGWHVGNFWYNSRMVGIEHVGYAAQDDYETAMYEKSADLVKTIAARHGLPLDRSTLIAHGEVPNGDVIAESSPPCTDSPGDCVSNTSYGGSNHHTDPGVYWEWCQYTDIMGGECKCNDAYELWNCVHDLSMMVRCAGGVVEIVHCADACVIEPIGTDDHCTPIMNTTSSAATGAGGGSSSNATTGGGGESNGASSGDGQGAGPVNQGDENGEVQGSCAVRPFTAPAARGRGGATESALGWITIGLAAAALARRRRA
jgi:N-acetylmuramoyl-L-alanine amidase